MTESPQFILFISSLHWFACILIYSKCIESEPVETVEPEQVETIETDETDCFVPMVDGVVDWGLVDKKVKK